MRLFSPNGITFLIDRIILQSTDYTQGLLSIAHLTTTVVGSISSLEGYIVASRAGITDEHLSTTLVNLLCFCCCHNFCRILNVESGWPRTRVHSQDLHRHQHQLIWMRESLHPLDLTGKELLRIVKYLVQYSKNYPIPS